MSDGFGSLMAVLFIVYFGICGLIAPVLGYQSWLEKRDCELVNQAECAWQMMPKEKNDDE